MTATAPKQTWTTLELELFRDGELPEDRRAALSEALRADPSLRTRLADVARMDAAAHRAFTEIPARAPGARRPSFGVLAAAAVVLIVAVAVMFSSSRPGAPARQLAAASKPRQEIAKARGFDVVFTIPVGRPLPQGAESPREKAAAPAAALVDQALADGRAEEANSLLAGANQRDREAAYRRMGESLRTAQAAREAIASLSDREKLEVCRIWTADARLVPVAFTILGELSTSAEVSKEYGEVVSQLRDDPRLRGYVLSYLPKSGTSGL